MKKSTTNLRFFTEREAWNVFRVAALSEAFGWTLLISGIAFSHFVAHNNQIAVKITGQIHGTIFFAYIAAAIVVGPSLKWSRKQSIVALAASIPPYGTLVYEQLVARQRRQQARTSHRQVVVRAIIMHRGKLLAMQPKENVFWCLPGGAINEHEGLAVALQRTVKAQTGIKPVVGELRAVSQYTHRGMERVEFFFDISNAPAFAVTKKSKHIEVEELAFIDPAKTKDLRPAFLQKEALRKTAKAVKFISAR